MISESGRRRRPGPRVAGVSVVAVVLGVVLAAVAVSPAGADEGAVGLGGTVRFNGGQPAGDVEIDLFTARSRWERGDYIGPAFTSSDGDYEFRVSPDSCFIAVAIAPLGSSFDPDDAGEVYDQRYVCSGQGRTLGIDFVLYREDTKPEPTTTTTQPPTTHPPTTQPPTTQPPTTQPPPPVCDYRSGLDDATRTVRGGGVIHIKWYYEIDVSDLPSEWDAVRFESADVSGWEAFVDRYGEISDSPRFYSSSRDLNLDRRVNIVTRRPLRDDVDLVGVVRVPPFTLETWLGWLDEVLPDGFVEVPVVIETASGKTEPRLLCIGIHIEDAVGYSPIALDVDRSGAIERIDTGVAFDFDADGEAEEVSEWFGPTEGILIDTRIDGAVTGEHLFGDQGGRFADGFEKLALLDGNDDGWVEGAELDGLAVWTDLDSDAELDPGERSTLASHGVEALSVSHIGFLSEARLADGSTMVTEDVWFSPAGPVAGRTDLTAAVGLGVVTIAMVGYSATTAARRRGDLDDELAELLDQEHTTTTG